MNDKEFISEFKKLTIASICRDLKVNYHNIMAGRAGYETTKRVANAIEDKIYDILDQRKDFIDIDDEIE